MTPRGNIIVWLVATAALAALTSWLVSHQTPRGEAAASGSAAAGAGTRLSLHEWMHRQLKLTEAQHAALAPLESEYEAERGRHLDNIRKLTLSLAQAMRDGAPDTAVLELQSRLHAAQGDLQQATLRHFIAMRRHLTSAQAREFALWTHDSLLLQPVD